MAGLTGWHLLLVAAVILLLFGAARLPRLAKSVGESIRILRKETKTEPTAGSVTAPPEPESSAGKHSPSAKRSPTP
jgi:sec-independent protein translocase protein TatA